MSSPTLQTLVLTSRQVPKALQTLPPTPGHGAASRSALSPGRASLRSASPSPTPSLFSIGGGEEEPKLCFVIQDPLIWMTNLSSSFFSHCSCVSPATRDDSAPDSVLSIFLRVFCIFTLLPACPYGSFTGAAE